MTKKPPKDLSDDDKAAWEAAAETVASYDKKNHAPRLEKPLKRFMFKFQREVALPSSNPRDMLEHGDTQRVDGNLAARLKSGKLPIEMTIDLHGLNLEQAQIRLLDALPKAYAQGKRAVLIVTGKGLRSKEPPGVLQKQVPRWLNDAPLSSIVLMYDFAQPKDGGSGALYVLLRRKR